MCNWKIELTKYLGGGKRRRNYGDIGGKMTFVYGFLLLNVLIIIHELGHFVVAKIMGVKVETFSVGFWKKIVGVKIGQTDFVISLIPLGGYVKMKQDENEDGDKQISEKRLEKDSYDAKNPLQKIAILFAGPLFNFLFAFGIIAWIACRPYEVVLPIVGDVNIGASSKEKEGFMSGDKILKVDGYEVFTWNDFADIVNSEDKETFVFEVKRGEKILNFSVGQFDISPANIVEKKYTPLWESLKEASNLFFDVLKEFLFDYKQMFLSLFESNDTEETQEASGDLGSVVGIYQDLGNTFSEGNALMVWIYLAMYSIMLGLFNLLPIAPLDGGKILLELYVLIFKKPINQKIEDTILYLGLLIVLCLIVFGTYNDILRLFSK